MPPVISQTPVKPLMVRRRKAAAMLDIGTTKLDHLISTHQIAAIKSGKQLLISVAELERYVASLPPAELQSNSYGKKRKRGSTDQTVSA